MPTIEATRPRTRVDHHEERAPFVPVQRPLPPPDRAIDAAVIAAARGFNDRTLYVGMNPGSVPSESAALGAGTTVIAGSSSHDVEAGGHTYDISTPNGVRGFVQTTAARNGLTLRQCEQLEGILLGSPAGGRDEIAKIAAVWATAERGAAIPSRLVISGHSSLGMVWGDKDTGVIHLQAVRDLGRVFENAAAQIEDIHVSGCFSEGEVQNVETWTLAFPNAKTVWAYSRFSPSPAAADLAAWKGATNGRVTTLSEGFVSRFGSATAWSVNGGIANASAGIAERRQLVDEADTRFDAYFSGRARITTAHDPAADRDYGAYQMLAAHRDATPRERAEATTRGGQMLRLRFWEASVRGEIAKQYGPQINEALTKAGLPEVDFRTLTREQALATIERFREVKGGLGPVMDGIVNLSPRVIPASFCH